MHDKSTCLICLMDKAEKARKRVISALSKMSDTERKKCLDEASKFIATKG